MLLHVLNGGCQTGNVNVIYHMILFSSDRQRRHCAVHPESLSKIKLQIQNALTKQKAGVC